MAVNQSELFPIVDESGRVVGKATRSECHGGSHLLHPVVHLHVVSESGMLYLQKRSLDKDIQPGKWDTAVGGHVDYGEDVTTALFRESKEELDLDDYTAVRIPPYRYDSDIESELVNPFLAIIEDGISINPDPSEISEGRFWSMAEIESNIGKGVFTPNFEHEYLIIKDFIK